MERSGQQDKTQAAESIKWRPQQAYGSSQVLLAQPQTVENPHAHAQIRERRGPQGTHAIATVKSPLWTTKWLTIVFPWPAQIVSSTISKPNKT